MKKVCVAIISRKNKTGETEYLLVSSKRDFGAYTGYYYPPGGHVEPGEEEKQTLIREVNEELGVDINPIQKVVETPGDVTDQITSWWLSEIISGELKLNDGTLSTAGYFTKSQMQNMNIWPATNNFFKKYIFI